MKKISLILALLLIVACLLPACGKKESGGLSINTDAPAAGNDTQIVTGMMDDTFTIPKSISKIVCLSPAASVILSNIGAADKLVAVDAESASLISTSAQTVDASGAAALSPEVIIVSAEDKDAVGATDIPVFAIPTAESVAEINNLVRLLGKITGVAVDDTVSSLTNVMNTAQLGSSAYSTKFRTYLDLDGKTVGTGTYVTEMLYAAGLENICTIQGFGEMSEADIAAADPEFIFTTGSVDDILNNAAFAEVTAVVNGHVYTINKADICYGTNTVGSAVTSMYENVSSTRGDE